MKRLLSSDHFSVDGTLIEAWASVKSFKPKDPGLPSGTGGGRNAAVDFRGETRSNATHVSTTDPDALLYRKGPGMEARLCYLGHGLMENGSGLLVDTRLTDEPSPPMGCQLIGRWRIVEADLWDRGYLELVEPATMVIEAHGRGEIVFGAMQAGLDLEYRHTLVFFTWEGCDEMTEVNGTGSAELIDDGTIEIEFAYHLGEEAILKAKCITSSTAC